VPVITLTVNAIPDSGSAPLTVYFAAFVSGGTPPYAFEWAFGDNTTPATTQNAVHTYPAGTYNAECTVTDANGFQDSSGPIPVTVSASIPNATYTVLAGQVCAADAPAPLAAVPAGPALEVLPAGPALEQLPAPDYYDRCLGEFISSTGVVVPVVVTSVSNSDGTLSISPTTGDVVASLNLGNVNDWTGQQTFDGGVISRGANGLTVLGTPVLGVYYGVNFVGSIGTITVTSVPSGEPLNLYLHAAAATLTLGTGTGDASTPTIVFASGGGGAAISFNSFEVGAALVFLDPTHTGGTATAMALQAGGAYSITAGYTLSVANTSSTSDSRLKDFAPYSGDPLAELAAARFGQYRTMAGVDLGSAQAGMAAETLPASVREVQPDGYYAVRSPNVEAWLLGVCQALLARIERLESGPAGPGKSS